MADLQTTGLQIRTVTEIKDEIESILKSAVSENLDFSASTLLGQLTSIVANQLGTLEELLMEIYTAMDPASAAGDALDRLAAITGVSRIGGRSTSISVELTFDSDPTERTYSAGTILLAPQGNETKIFTNVNDVVVSPFQSIVSDVSMASIDFEAIPIVLGPSGPGTLSVLIDEVPAGLLAADGKSLIVFGFPQESDTSLRARRTKEIFLPGTGTTNAILSALLAAFPDAKSIKVFDNPTGVVVDSIDPYAVEAVILAPLTTPDDIAQVIFDQKSAGTPTSGNTEGIAIDSQNNTHLIKYTEPVEVPVTIDIRIQYHGVAYPGKEAVKSALSQKAIKEWLPGDDVHASEIIHWIFSDIAGIKGVQVAIDSLIIGANIQTKSINTREVAIVAELGDITITDEEVSE